MDPISALPEFPVHLVAFFLSFAGKPPEADGLRPLHIFSLGNAPRLRMRDRIKVSVRTVVDVGKARLDGDEQSGGAIRLREPKAFT